MVSGCGLWVMLDVVPDKVPDIGGGVKAGKGRVERIRSTRCGYLLRLADPIFQGLAISLLFGAIASLIISPLAVPMLYYLVKRKSTINRPCLTPTRKHSTSE